MQIRNNTFNPLPIMESKEDWYSNQATYKGTKQPTKTKKNFLLPMQLNIDEELYNALQESGSKLVVQAVNNQGERKTLKVTPTIELMPEDIRSADNYAMLFIGNEYLISTPLNIGTYYLEIHYSNTNDVSKSKTWYSDLFCMVDDVKDMVHLKYRNTTPIQVGDTCYIPFKRGDANVYMDVYLDATIMMNVFNFENTVEQQDGYERVKKRVSTKKLNTSFYCTEYMADALRLMWHCDSITMSYKGKKYKIDNVDMSASWDISNHFCKVDMQFAVDTVIQTNAHAIMQKDLPSGADFNNDFNDDFGTEHAIVNIVESE